MSINLHTSEREVLWKAPPYAGRARWTVPFATSAYMWPCGSSAILLYGGRSPEGQGPLPGHMLIDPPPLADMWRFDLDLLSWTRIPRGGGGSPPAPRAEAALAPLIGGGFDPGSAVILGGYSELLHEILPMSRDAYSFRYCDDAHFFSPTTGWYRLAPAGPRAPPAASVAAGAVSVVSDSAVILFCGGYSGLDRELTYEQVCKMTF